MSHEKPFLNTLNFVVFTRDTKVVGSSRNDFARTWMSRCACETFYPNFVTFQNTFKTHFKTRSICSRMPNRPSMWDGAFYPNKIFTQIDSAPLQDKCKCYLQKKEANANGCSHVLSISFSESKDNIFRSFVLLHQYFYIVRTTTDMQFVKTNPQN